MRHVTSPTGAGGSTRTAVWICEYPYRTMRASGPSIECEGCPVWEELQETRQQARRAAGETATQLSLMIGA
jgi:hypothetical protein